MGESDDVGDCVFCRIVTGIEPALIVKQWSDAVAFTPRNPVAMGHVLVVSRVHVRDAVESPTVTALTMARAAELAAGYSYTNILTSVGVPAKQSVFHLHVHIVPRFEGDQLMLPWGTTGDPHEPHRCAGMDRLDTELTRARAGRPGLITDPVASPLTMHPPDPPARYVPVPVEG